MKKLFFIFIPLLIIGCSDNKKQKLEKMEIDPSYTELTPEKIHHSVQSTINVVDPFAQKLVDVQQVGDVILRKEAKKRK